MLGAVFERFVEKSPISVMVRAALERVLGADRLDLWYERTAQKQYTRDLLFSSVYDLMNQVVFCVQPSVRAAYQAHQNDVGTSLVSVYNKLNGLETHTAAELVRYSAREFAPLIKHMGGERAPWLEGYRVKIVDGNCLEASEHRIKELRAATGRALPGKSLVVYEPALGVVTDVFPCENGHAQERSLFGAVLDTVEASDLWIEDRNFCTRAFLCEIDKRGAFCVTREHQGLPFEILTPLRSYGRTPTGQVAQQRVCVVDTHGHKHIFRRLRIKLNEATRDGATIIHILTNLPHQVSAQQVADLYRKRWTLETAFKHLEAYFHSEINTLGYPKAAAGSGLGGYRRPPGAAMARSAAPRDQERAAGGLAQRRWPWVMAPLCRALRGSCQGHFGLLSCRATALAGRGRLVGWADDPGAPVVWLGTAPSAARHAGRGAGRPGGCLRRRGSAGDSPRDRADRVCLSATAS